MMEHSYQPFHSGRQLIESLLLTLTLLLTIFAAPSQAGISCYSSTDGGTENHLRDDFGVARLKQCTSAEDSCFEVLDKSAKEIALYKAGCGKYCPKLQSSDVECKTCSESLCNNVLATEIQANNLLCYLAKNEKSIGKRKVWCAKGVKECFWISREDTSNHKMYYSAGCSADSAICLGCKTCKTELCNVPDDMKHSAVGRSQDGAAGKVGGDKKGNVTGADVKGDDGGGDKVDAPRTEPAGNSNKGKKKSTVDRDTADRLGADYDNCAVPSAAAAFAIVLAAIMAAALAKIVGLAD